MIYSQGCIDFRVTYMISLSPEFMYPSLYESQSHRNMTLPGIPKMSKNKRVSITRKLAKMPDRIVEVICLNILNIPDEFSKIIKLIEA
jgi:hypothetical protein